MEKTEYIAPEVKLFEISPDSVIAQSYGDPGKAGNSIYEQSIEGW